MIHIVGAGIGGLALAQGLLRRGIPCRVYERDSDLFARGQGYRISLNALGRRALEALLPPGRFAQIAALECRDVGREMTFAVELDKPLLRLRDADAWTVCRPRLRAVLAGGVPIEFGAKVQSLCDVPDDGGLVVAADGINSKLRDSLRDVATVPVTVETGVHTVGGLVPRTSRWNELLPMNQWGAVQYFGPHGQSAFVSFCETDSREPMILWALSQRADSVVPDTRWHPKLLELFNATSPTERQLMSIRSTRLLRPPGRRVHPRVTLLGDAAHGMPPQRGQGGNQAFEDARRLCESLGDIAAYERDLFSRGLHAVEESEEALQLVHFKNPLATGLRNTVMRLMNLLARGPFSRAASTGG